MYYIGIDIGGTTIKGGMVADDGTIIYKSAIPTEADAGCEKFVKSIADFCLDIVDKSGVSMDDVKSIGMGMPGTIDSEKGVVLYTNNIDLKNAHIAEEFQKFIKKDVYLDNDANCAALGEFFALGGGKLKDFVAVTLGTGVGGGIIINGKLFSGHGGEGGEIGHMVIELDGEECTCGRKGCWEAYASATALIRQAKSAAMANKDSKLFKYMEQNDGKLNGEVIWNASKEGDTIARAVTDKYCEYVAQGVVNVVNIFRPEVVAIGGGVSKAGDALLNPVKAYAEKYHYGAGYSKLSDIVIAKLGNDAGIIGAAFLGK